MELVKRRQSSSGVKMSVRPIEESKDPDLIGSLVAMRRAAQKAKEIAEKSGTKLIVSEDELPAMDGTEKSSTHFPSKDD